MASIYLHIPFCKQACNYCNFHFSTQTSYVQQMVDCLLQELDMRKHELNDEPLSSVYFGGGTPSILSAQHLDQLFDGISKHYRISTNAEFTLEANPDDITKEKLAFLKTTPVNRFSMGVQSFFDEDLQWMNRAHQATEAEKSIRLIQEFGFDKITIDLIYGSPTLSLAHWEQNLNKVLELHLNHLSAYCLTAEPQTALQHQIQKGNLAPLDEEKAALQFDFMIDFLEGNHFEQYEISNFARNQEYAIHNTSYWQNKPYLGIGPSAHSFNGHQRSWNIANNQTYMRQIQDGILPAEVEELTEENKINEYIMTGLRTIWGCDWAYLNEKFNADLVVQLEEKLNHMVAEGKIENNSQNFKLTRSARILADGIASDLFF